MPGRRPWLLIIAALASVVGVLVPLGYLLVRALEADAEQLGRLLWRERNAQLILNTLKLSGGVAVAVTALALPAAWLTSRCRLPGQRLVTLLLVLPLAIPGYLMAFTFLAAGGPYGSAARLTGIQLPVLSGYWGALAALSLYLFPYMYLNLRAALLRADASQEEAARALGAGSLRICGSVVLPQIWPALLAGALLVVLHAIGDFGVVSLMRYETLSYALYLQYVGGFDRTYSAWIALMLLVLSLAFIVGELMLVRNLRLDRVGRGAARQRTLAPLGLWSLPAYAFLAAVLLAALAVPLATILYWLARADAWALADVPAALWNSSRASLPAAVLATLAALPVAWLAARHAGRYLLLERLAYVGYATPPLAFALGIAFFALHYLPALYHTIWLLIYAYSLRFVAESLGPLRSAILASGRRYEESSRSLGRGPLATFTRVTLPMIRGGLIVSVAFVFLSCMKELPLTVLLSPLGFHTLAYNAWDATNEALYAHAAPFALAIVVASGLLVGLLLLVKKESS